MEGQIRLGYWKIRGLASAIRLLLRYRGIPYHDELYQQGDAPHFDSGIFR